MRTSDPRPLLVLGLLLISSLAAAQSAPSSTPAPSERSWKFDPRLVVGTEYDDNVFLLPSNKRNAPGAPSAADQLSGRYVGMESAGDLITTASVVLSVETPGVGGRDLRFTPAVAYEAYAQSGERSNVAFGLSVEQAVRRGGRLRVRGSLQPRYFARNYLADAIDANSDGTITADERIYLRGEYRESEIQADYRLRLAKSTRSRPFGAWLIVGGGFADRSHGARFVARDFSGPSAAARLQFDLPRGVELVTTYDLAVLSSPRTAQVMLLDELVYGEDLNGNGNATDLNARTSRTVDRSRTEHLIGETARFELGRHTDLELSVELRLRDFSSVEPYDAANNGRRDRRVQFGVDLSRRVAKGVRMFAGARYGSQGLNRRTDLGADGAVDDYTKLQAHLGLRYAP